MKAIRILTILLLTLLLLASLCLPAFAAGGPRSVMPRDPDDLIGAGDASKEGQDGEDDYENQPVPADDDRVWLSNTMFFDMLTGEFIYPVGSSDAEVRSNTADGMITSGPVVIKGKNLQVYRNGQLWENDVTNITEPGEYVVIGQAGSQNPRLFTFRLVGRTTSVVHSYKLPAGMIVDNAKFNGEEIYFERFSVPMEEDGKYNIEYECLTTGRKYGLEVIVDRQPPSLQFSGNIDKRNRVHSALKFSGVQPGDTLRVTLDGKAISVDVNADGTGELPQSGNYLITVFDAAGNSTQYAYTVMIYLNSSALVFFLILGASILAVAIYILIKRERGDELCSRTCGTPYRIGWARR